MTARARVWVGDWTPARCQSMDPPDTDHCHLSRRGRVPDEKTPGHEATISPPSRTCTLKIEGVEDPRASCPDGTVSDQGQNLRSVPLRFHWSKFDPSNWSLSEGRIW
ncbi:hypothetical protein EVAR_34082_1 [Eumeta japonica]|uniref:Uncharacterized protein n=1 Tax=Eumeta variegata TaxID=151549 RepID=A0A4C1WIL4_EUMVA|nr:hypothetical protein EVAR_34082_1 [Eumeta japonica]